MTPKEFIQACNDGALEILLTEMVNRGFDIPTLEVIKNNINKSSYDQFAITIAKSLNINYKSIKKDDRLSKYIADLSVDISMQFNAIQSMLFTSELNLNWFRYMGSNLTTTRPFCLAMTEKDYFHQCEIPKLLLGEFPEFQKNEGVFDEYSELPAGLYSNTDESNFRIYRGGYGCGHSISPIAESAVPDEIKSKLYSTEEYKNWTLK